VNRPRALRAWWNTRLPVRRRLAAHSGSVKSGGEILEPETALDKPPFLHQSVFVLSRAETARFRIGLALFLVHLLSQGQNARSHFAPSRTQELQSELQAGENPMICRRTESNDILLKLVAKTLAVGATEMLNRGRFAYLQVEYEDREEHVLAFREGVGFGIASLDARSEEAQALREALYQIRRKQKIVTIEGVEYRLRARIHQSFGEDLFRVTIKKAKP
jgi:hypothetical protein